jgi:DGQHR domain-containing protein
MSLTMINITIPVPCIQGAFGQRLLTYTTQIRPSQIRQILGHDPRSTNWKLLPDATRKIYEQVQRPTSKGRRDGVAEYLVQRFQGTRKNVAAFPSISIGFSHHAEFKAIVSVDEAVGILHIHDQGHRIVLDGLARISGCLDLLEDKDINGAAIVESITLPITFYLPAKESGPLSVHELGQLFADFNFRVHPVPAQINISLDQSDIYIDLANELGKQPFIADCGGMEIKAASLSKKSSALVVQTVLVRAVRGATEGREFQESNLARPQPANLTDESFVSEFQSIRDFFTHIAARMGERWTDRESLHLSSPGWQALGVIHFDMNHRGLVLSHEEKAAMYDALATINWSRTNQQWVTEAKFGVWDKPKKASTEQVVLRGAGRNNIQAMIDFLRWRTGLDEKMKASHAQATSILMPPMAASDQEGSALAT